MTLPSKGLWNRFCGQTVGVYADGNRRDQVRSGRKERILERISSKGLHFMVWQNPTAVETPMIL